LQHQVPNIHTVKLLKSTVQNLCPLITLQTVHTAEVWYGIQKRTTQTLNDRI